VIVGAGDKESFYVFGLETAVGAEADSITGKQPGVRPPAHGMGMGVQEFRDLGYRKQGSIRFDRLKCFSIIDQM
jgi:hypothetical protein